MIKLKAWVVDDDISYQGFLSSFLNTAGFTSERFSSGEQCLKYLHDKPDVIILDDNQGGDFGGIEVLRKIKELEPDVPVIYTAGRGNISLCSEVFKNGSMDFIEKDCASLIRLKIRLDKIKKLKILRSKRRNYKIAMTGGLIALLVGTAILLERLICHPVW